MAARVAAVPAGRFAIAVAAGDLVLMPLCRLLVFQG
jgi:hypothetical protein